METKPHQSFRVGRWLPMFWEELTSQRLFGAIALFSTFVWKLDAHAETPPRGAAEEDLVRCELDAPSRSCSRLAIVLPQEAQSVDVGRELVIPVSASSDEGASLTFSVRPLPEGATFSNSERTFRWSPSQKQTGVVTVFFSVSDGRYTHTSPLSIKVIGYTAPRFDPYAKLHFVVGVRSRVTIANAPKWWNSKVTAEALPEGAEIVTHGSGSVQVDFMPLPEQEGSHTFVVHLDDGTNQVSHEFELTVVPAWARGDFVTHLVIGGGYAAFLPVDREAYGVLHGPSLEWTLSAWRESPEPETLACTSWTRNCKASHRRLYVRGDLLFSSEPDVALGALYAAGFSSSLLWPAARRFLIPHYSIELGGLYHRSIGHQLQVTPMVGLWLWTGDTLWLDANLGYRVVPWEITRLRGVTGNLTAMLGRW